MGKFAKAETQAASVINALQRAGDIRSLGTARGYKHALTRAAEYVKSNRWGSLRDITQDRAIEYLEQRSEAIGQKALDMERQALQIMMQQLTRQLNPNARLPVIRSIHQQVLQSRSYTPEQVSIVAKSQKSSNALATQIAHAAGLRAHELLTLRPIHERKPSHRPALATKFLGRSGELYTVKGKGGLVRVVIIPFELSQRLESLRLNDPISATDRDIHYAQHYQISAGSRWSASFGSASKRSLGWSSGAHGLRHSYAQERMHELQCLGFTRDISLQTVSQEMGHFRSEITEVYLR